VKEERRLTDYAGCRILEKGRQKDVKKSSVPAINRSLRGDIMKDFDLVIDNAAIAASVY